MAEQASPGKEVAVLGGGCFWCVEAVLTDLRGVVSVLPGYSGGHVDQPSYEQVCRKDTGHIEVARVEFDPAVLSYGDLLRVFLPRMIPPRRVVRATMSVRNTSPRFSGRTKPSANRPRPSSPRSMRRKSMMRPS